MTHPLTPPASDPLPARVAAFVEHLELQRSLPQQLRGAPPNQVDAALLREALERLHLEHEELVVAEEELRMQMEAMGEAERQRDAAQHRYQEVFHLSPEPLMITDRLGVLREANLSALQLLDIDGRAAYGKPLAALIDTADVAAFRSALTGLGAERRVELTLRLRRGGRESVILRGVLPRDEQGVLWSARELLSPPGPEGVGPGGSPGRTAAALTGTGRRLQRQNADLASSLATEREARVSAERSRDAMVRAMAVLSHELRAPVTLVLGWTRLLRDGSVAQPEWPAALATIERYARAQTALVGELLDASAVASGNVALRLDVLDVGALVSSTVEAMRPVAEEKSVTLRCEAAGELSALADPLRLGQVMTNLLTNAIKFTPEGGQVSARCEAVEAVGGRRTVRVAIEDNGRGLRPSEAESIFGFFERGRDGKKHGRSLGLGLYLVRQYVELHGGSVFAEPAAADAGARFVVTLPGFAAPPGR